MRSYVKCFDSALAFLENYDPKQLGCLLLDFLMPTMNGLDLQDELKKRNIVIPIIFISGHGNIPISSKAFRNGAIDFLEKPLDDKLLLERINETLNKAQLNWEKQCINREVSATYSQSPCVRIVVASKINFRGKKNESKIYRRL